MPVSVCQHRMSRIELTMAVMDAVGEWHKMLTGRSCIMLDVICSCRDRQYMGSQKELLTVNGLYKGGLFRVIRKRYSCRRGQ